MTLPKSNVVELPRLSFNVVSDVQPDKSSLPPFCAKKVCVASAVSAGIANSVMDVSETARFMPTMARLADIALSLTPETAADPLPYAMTLPVEPVLMAGMLTPFATFTVPFTTRLPVRLALAFSVPPGLTVIAAAEADVIVNAPLTVIAVAEAGSTATVPFAASIV